MRERDMGRLLSDGVIDYGEEETYGYYMSCIGMALVATETSKLKHVFDNMGGGYGRLPDQATRKKMADLLMSFT